MRILLLLLAIISSTYAYAKDCSSISKNNSCSEIINTLIKTQLNDKGSSFVQKHQAMWEVLNIIDNYNISASLKTSVLGELNALIKDNSRLQLSYSFYPSQKPSSIGQIDNFLATINSNLIKHNRSKNFEIIKSAYIKPAGNKREFTLKNIQILMKQPIELSVSHHEPGSPSYQNRLNNLKRYSEMVYNKEPDNFTISKAELVQLMIGYTEKVDFVTIKELTSGTARDLLHQYFIKTIKKNTKLYVNETIEKQIINAKTVKEKKFSLDRLKELMRRYPFTQNFWNNVLSDVIRKKLVNSTVMNLKKKLKISDPIFEFHTTDKYDMQSAKGVGLVPFSSVPNVFSGIVPNPFSNYSEDDSNIWKTLKDSRNYGYSLDGCNTYGGPNKSMSIHVTYGTPHKLKTGSGTRLTSNTKTYCDGKSCYKDYFKGVKDLTAQAQASAISMHQFPACSEDSPCLPLVGIKINELTEDARVEIHQNNKKLTLHSGTHFYNRTEGDITVLVVASSKCEASGKGNQVTKSMVDVELLHPRKDFSRVENYHGIAENIIYPYFTQTNTNEYVLNGGPLKPQNIVFSLNDMGLNINRQLFDMIYLSSAIQNNNFILKKVEMDSIDIVRGFLKRNIQEEVKSIPQNLDALKHDLTIYEDTLSNLLERQLEIKLLLLQSNYVLNDDVTATLEIVRNIANSTNINLDSQFETEFLSLSEINSQLNYIISKVEETTSVLQTQVSLASIYL